MPETLSQLLARPRDGADTSPATAIEDFNQSNVGTLEAVMNNPSSEASSERVDHPSGASFVDRAADRLQKFAVNRAHDLAIKENTARDGAAQNEAYASYEGNIATTANREEDERLEDLAYDRNEKIDAKAARSERRAEKRTEAKSKLRGFGRSALRYVATKYNGGIDSAMRGLDSGADKVGSVVTGRVEQVKNTIDAVREAREYRKQEAIRRKEKALSRKYERQAKWAKRREAFKQYGRNAKEGFTDTKEAVSDAAKTRARKIGRSATSTLDRARATKTAAVETWKNYES